MVLPSLGNHLLRVFVFERNFYIGKGFGIISSRKILERSMKLANREVVMKT
jgi:hypothetical protein